MAFLTFGVSSWWKSHNPSSLYSSLSVLLQGNTKLKSGNIIMQFSSQLQWLSTIARIPHLHHTESNFQASFSISFQLSNQAHKLLGNFSSLVSNTVSKHNALGQVSVITLHKLFIKCCFSIGVWIHGDLKVTLTPRYMAWVSKVRCPSTWGLVTFGNSFKDKCWTHPQITLPSYMHVHMVTKTSHDCFKMGKTGQYNVTLLILSARANM